jgi:DNA mismatch repair ATPase MutS
MDIDILENKEFKYTYKLSDGISNIKGGVKVLRDLEYPEPIISETENYLENN